MPRTVIHFFYSCAQLNCWDCRSVTRSPRPQPIAADLRSPFGLQNVSFPVRKPSSAQDLQTFSPCSCHYPCLCPAAWTSRRGKAHPPPGVEVGRTSLSSCQPTMLAQVRRFPACIRHSPHPATSKSFPPQNGTGEGAGARPGERCGCGGGAAPEELWPETEPHTSPSLLEPRPTSCFHRLDTGFKESAG